MTNRGPDSKFNLLYERVKRWQLIVTDELAVEGAVVVEKFYLRAEVFLGLNPLLLNTLLRILEGMKVGETRIAYLRPNVRQQSVERIADEAVIP